jgi:hypothetical protein
VIHQRNGTIEPLIRTVKDLIDSLHPDDAALARAREQVAARRIDYPLGSGQAEEIALLAGLKPMIRQQLDPSHAAAMRGRFEKLGLATHAEGPLVYVGRDPAALREAARAEVARDVRTAGRLLGYPPCCVEAFADDPRRANAELVARALAATRGRPNPRLDCLDLAVFHYVSWMPCAFDCAPSGAYADRTAAKIAERHPAFVAAIDRALAVRRILILDEVQISTESKRAWATMEDRDPRAPASPEAAEAVARVLAVAGDRPLGVDGTTLRAGDRELLRSARLLGVDFS